MVFISTIQCNGIANFQWAGNNTIFYNPISPCDFDIDLQDIGEPLTATDCSDYLWIRSITIAFDLYLNIPV